MNEPTKPLEVEVGLDEPVMSDRDLREALKRQGFAEMGLANLRDVRAVGIFLKGAGVLKMQRGRALISQQRLDEAMRQLKELLTEVLKGRAKARVGNAVKVALALAGVADVLTKQQKFMAELDPQAVPGSTVRASDPPANKGFVPGADIHLGVTFVQREAKQVVVHEINGRTENKTVDSKALADAKSAA